MFNDKPAASATCCACLSRPSFLSQTRSASRFIPILNPFTPLFLSYTLSAQCPSLDVTVIDLPLWRPPKKAVDE